MTDIEKISETAMSVITYAGMAKSCYIEALRLYRAGDQKGYAEKMAEGDTNFTQAHSSHAHILQQEMTDGEPQISMLLAHAEDQLMSAETIKVINDEIREILEDKKEK